MSNIGFENKIPQQQQNTTGEMGEMSGNPAGRVGRYAIPQCGGNGNEDNNRRHDDDHGDHTNIQSSDAEVIFLCVLIFFLEKWTEIFYNDNNYGDK